jgi:type II secretory pathway pseudopilin PulG
MMGLILARKRKGFTVLEESIVIAIIALLAIPLVTLLNESIRAQVYGTKDVKGQYYANLIMQDFERRVRQATTNSIVITTGNPYKLNFTYEKADKNGKNPVATTYTYEIDDPNTDNSIFYRQVDGNAKAIFPVGLKKGIITNFTIVNSNIDTTNNDAPYYVTVQIETSAGTILQKTIYLVNYYKQE